MLLACWCCRFTPHGISAPTYCGWYPLPAQCITMVAPSDLKSCKQNAALIYAWTVCSKHQHITAQQPKQALTAHKQSKRHSTSETAMSFQRAGYLAQRQGQAPCRRSRAAQCGQHHLRGTMHPIKLIRTFRRSGCVSLRERSKRLRHKLHVWCPDSDSLCVQLPASTPL